MVKILVVKTEDLFKDYHFEGFMPIDEKDYINYILNNHYYEERNEDLENNPDYDPSLILPLLERQKVTNIIYEVNPEIYNLKFKTKKELYDKMKSMDREEIITNIDISNIVDFYNSIGSLIRK